MRVPDEAAVTVNVSLCTFFHTAAADLGLELPWPIPGSSPRHKAGSNILVWGVSSSVGIYAVQVLPSPLGLHVCSRRRERQARGVSFVSAKVLMIFGTRLSVLVRSRNPPRIHRNRNIPVHEVVHGINFNLGSKQESRKIITVVRPRIDPEFFEI